MSSTVTRIDPGPRLSEASVFDGRIHCSGMIPEDTTADIAGQVRQALAEIEALLARGGSDKTKILSATIWLADINDFAAMNAVWDAWVVPGQTPARATVQARLNDPKGRDHGGGGGLALGARHSSGAVFSLFDSKMTRDWSCARP